MLPAAVRAAAACCFEKPHLCRVLLTPVLIEGLQHSPPASAAHGVAPKGVEVQLCSQGVGNLWRGHHCRKWQPIADALRRYDLLSRVHRPRSKHRSPKHAKPAMPRWTSCQNRPRCCHADLAGPLISLALSTGGRHQKLRTLAIVTMSGCTPWFWKPQKWDPVRPKPVCTSSAMHTPPAALTSYNMNAWNQ